MKTDNIKDQSRYIVNEIHYGSISPGNRSEMWRNVYLESGAIVKGGVFGNSLSIINPGVLIEESVFVRGEIKINLGNNETDKEVVFGSTVVSPDSIVIEGSKSITRFNSDVYINKLNISNSVIYGNVYSSSAIIKNCIILGGVFCKNKLYLENSIVFTFDTNELEIKNNVSLLSPFGISKSPFVIEYPVKALTFFNLKEGEKDESFIVNLNDDDIFELKQSDSDVSEKRYLLSIVERVLNSTEIINSFKANKKIHYYPTKK
jgi:hypothetical protein